LLAPICVPVGTSLWTHWPVTE